MENYTVRIIELKEYVAPEGKVFRKVDVSVDENGDRIEIENLAIRLIGPDIDIALYEVVDVADRELWEQEQI